MDGDGFWLGWPRIAKGDGESFWFILWVPPIVLELALSSWCLIVCEFFWMVLTTFDRSSFSVIFGNI
jgi:hypothetical protein